MPQETTHHFDAIVIGAGMSGGWAAKELCDKGIKTLLLGKRSQCRTHQRLSHH